MPGTADPATSPWLWSSQAPGVSPLLSLYQMDTASHCPLDLYLSNHNFSAALRPHQRSFFVQQMAVNLETH